MKDTLSIKEFSQLSGIAPTTLRYWDEIDLFKPAMRHEENNYRYYTPEQMIAVNFISVLSSLGVPLKNIAALQDIRTPENVMDLIDRQETVLNAEMQRLRECYTAIHTRRELIKTGQEIDSEQLYLRNMEGWRLVLGSPTRFTDRFSFYEDFFRFCESAESLRINLNYPVGALHLNVNAFFERPGAPDHFFSLDPFGNYKTEPGQYLMGYNRGYYGQFGDLPERMKAYAEEQKLRFKGPLIAVYLHDEVCISEKSEYLVQVGIRVDSEY
ncbi:MAG: MerR family transcriptional regulator [Clostridiales bacterium]|nr:MerR family transcriptional regulator [Clostridiales bacterium]